jgi:hypothetical protein
MLNSVAERLINYPMPVHFAGFEGNTRSLQSQGWELSVHQDVRYQSLQLAMRHRSAGVYGLSQRIDHFEFEEAVFRSTRGDFEILKNTVFNIQSFRPSLQVERVVHHDNDSGTFFGRFEAFDASPMFVRHKIERIEDFKIFRPVAAAHEVIVDPKDVPGLLDLILNEQTKTQKEIRMREQSRENLQRYRRFTEEVSCEGNLIAKPDTECHLQLISLTA